MKLKQASARARALQLHTLRIPCIDRAIFYFVGSVQSNSSAEDPGDNVIEATGRTRKPMTPRDSESRERDTTEKLKKTWISRYIFIRMLEDSALKS